MSDIFQAPLPERFALALRLMEQLEEGRARPGSPEHGALYRRTLALLSTCLVMTEQLNLLDGAAPIDEFSAKSLRYMAMDYYIGKLLDESYINPSEGSIVGRLRVAKAALRKFYDFMLVLADHDLLEEAFAAQATPNAVLPEGRYGRSRLPDLISGVLRGDRMSAMFRLRPTKATQKDSLRYGTPDRGEIEHSGSVGEEQRREELTRLRVLGRRTIEALRSCWREIELLIFAVPESQRHALATELEDAYLPKIVVTAQNIGRGRAPPPDVLANPDVDDPNLMAAAGAGSTGPDGFTFADARESVKQRDENLSTRVDAPPAGTRSDAILGPEGQVLKPFVLTNGRDNVARQVMGTGQVLPTMTIEEAAEYELKHRAMPAPAAAPEIDEDSELYVDMETMKARQWDDFTEANPRGSGNTMNRG